MVATCAWSGVHDRRTGGSRNGGASPCRRLVHAKQVKKGQYKDPHGRSLHTHPSGVVGRWSSRSENASLFFMHAVKILCKITRVPQDIVLEGQRFP